MRGMLFVTNDLKTFLANNPQEKIQVTEWKFEDFSDDLKRVSQGRSFASGQQLFKTLGCAQCHKLSDAVATAGGGQAVGPNIDATVKKYKQDAGAVLREILDSSRNIDEKYRQVIVALEDGRTRTGVIAAEDDKTLTLLSGSPPQEVQIPKQSIDDRAVSTVSIMPRGLLNTVNKDQILDLVAYLLSGGNPDDPAFKQ